MSDASPAVADTGEVFRDRRASIRLQALFEVALSDHAFRWQGKGFELAPDGCAIRTAPTFPAGTRLRLRLSAPWTQRSLEIDGDVKHLTRGMLGIGFVLTQPETFERALDHYERLQLADASLGIVVARSALRLPSATVLVATEGVRATTFEEEERRVFALVDGRRTLAQIKASIGPSWPQVAHVPFALLHRGQAYLHGKKPKALALSAQASGRSAQVERYLESARALVRAGDRRQARLNVLLASSMAPGDAEIARLLADLE